MPHLKINRALEPFVTKHKPIKVAIGGRGSGKSIGFGDIFTMKMETEGADIYCLREFQDSINDSVHRVFDDSINKRLQLQGWDVQANKVISPRGSSTVYKGASRNPDSIQSAQGYKYSWFEEAHRASQDSLDKLIPTIIRNPGAECWFSANPQSSNDPFSLRFITPHLDALERDGYYEDDIHSIIVVNWRHNPWWNEEQEAIRKWDLENRSRAEYDWIWEGKFKDTVENAIIKPEWFDACVDAHKKLGFEPSGIEVVAHDPSDCGNDDKALCYRHGVVIKEVKLKTFGDVNEGCDWALDYCHEVKADAFIWDVDGMGTGLKRQVKVALEGKQTAVLPFSGGGAVENPDSVYEPIEGEIKGRKARTNKDAFFNLRAQKYNDLRDRCWKTYQAVEEKKYIDQNELISFDSSMSELRALRSELCRIPQKDNGVGKFQILSKPQMVKIGIESPNAADTVMMSFAIQSIKRRNRSRKRHAEVNIV